MMMNIQQVDLAGAVVVGIGAALIMDLWNLFLQRTFNIASLNFCFVGRWLSHMALGTFTHARIDRCVPQETSGMCDRLDGALFDRCDFFAYAGRGDFRYMAQTSVSLAGLVGWYRDGAHPVFHCAAGLGTWDRFSQIASADSSQAKKLDDPYGIRVRALPVRYFMELRDTGLSLAISGMNATRRILRATGWPPVNVRRGRACDETVTPVLPKHEAAWFYQLGL
jgi:hypothetical protein